MNEAGSGTRNAEVSEMRSDTINGTTEMMSDAVSSRPVSSVRERLTRRRAAGAISSDRNFVTALGRGLMVLESFAGRSVWQNSTEVASAVGLPKPTTSRLLQGLAAAGYLHYSPRRRQYRLGAAVLALGFAARDSYGIADLVHPYLEQLADEFSVHAALCGRDRLDVIHLEVCHSNKTLMTLRLEVGSRIPLAGTATGHALLAVLPDPELRLLMGHLRQRHAKHWPDISAKIEEGLRQFGERGYTWSVASWRQDINGVAVPLMPAEGPPLALSCGAPARHLPRRTMDEIGRRLIAVRDAVSAQTSVRATDGAATQPGLRN